MIAIVAYGVGNVRAFANIYKRHGLETHITGSADDLKRATHIILPGVGAFDWAMERLCRSGLREVLDEMALRDRKPILGVCVGMQMMADGSEEGRQAGLGWIPGRVARIANGPKSLPLPHMGWNEIAPTGDPIFEGISLPPSFYFLHSFHLLPEQESTAIAHTDYGSSLVCAVRQDNLVGVQFHPEKSHHWGERLLTNFAAT